MESTEDMVLGVESDDHSILCRPIQLGTSGVQHILRGIQRGTPEVRNLLMNECDLIYECKVCKSLHRSLANFIAHKRVYCTRHCCETMMLFNAQDTPEEYVVVQPTAPTLDDSASAESLRDQLMTCAEPLAVPPVQSSPSPSVGSSKSARISASISAADLAASDSCSSDDVKIVSDTNADRRATSGFRRPVEPDPPKKPPAKDWKQVLVKLESLKENKNAVYQVVSREPGDPPPRPPPRIRSAVSNSNATRRLARPIAEKRKATPPKPSPSGAAAAAATNHADRRRPSPAARVSDSAKNATVAREESDGDVSDGGEDKKLEPFPCCRCGLKFNSLKTLTYHLKTIHAKHRVYFPCLFCKAVFSQSWGVVRHLLTVHHKSKEQVNQLRNVIRRRAMQRARRDRDSSNEEEDDEEKNRTNVRVNGTSNHPTTPQQNNADNSPPSPPPPPPAPLKIESRSCDRCDATFQDDDQAWRGHIKICRVQRKVDSARQQPARLVEPRKLLVDSAASHRRNDHVDGRPKRLVKRKMHDDFVSGDTATNGVKLPSSVDNKSQQSLALKMAALIDTAKRECRECGAKFTRLSNLRRHAAGHAGYNRYKCKYCDYYTYAKAQCLVHIRRIHPARGKRLQPEKLIVDLLASSGGGAAKSGATITSTTTSSKTSTSSKRKSGASRSRKDSGKQQPSSRELNSAIANASFKSILERRGQSSTSALNGSNSGGSGGASSSSSNVSLGSKFNISTRMSPRTFDTSPYRPSSNLLSSLRTRSSLTSK